jgi:hypothetical protein
MYTPQKNDFIREAAAAAAAAWNDTRPILASLQSVC